MFPIVADEDIDRAIVEKLRNAGVEIFSIDEIDEEFATEYRNKHEFLYVTGPASDDDIVEAVCDVIDSLERTDVHGLVYISPG